MKNRQFATLAILSMTLGLSACTPQKNPLTQVSHKQAATFLVNASNYAEVKLKKHWDDRGYLQCMAGKRNETTCKTLYRTMLTYAKTKPTFKGLTLANLNDNTVWQTLMPYYKRIVFETLPDEIDT